MKYLIYTVLAVILLGLNAGLLSYFKFFGAMPNLLLILAVFSAMEKESHDFFYISAVCGLLLDFYMGLPVGSFALSLTVVCLAVHLAVRNILALEIGWKYLAGVLLVSIALVYGMLYLYNVALYRLGIVEILVGWQSVKSRFIPELAYSLLFAYPMYILAAAVRQFVSDIQSRQRSKISGAL